MIISGTYNLKYNPLWRQQPLEAIYLECDTSIAPVTINLFEIAETKLFWNVKFFISDKSNNCSVNNITVNSGGVDSIDILGKTSFIMNANGSSVELQIASNNKWMALESNTVISTYKVYTALLTQSGTSDPIAIVLENTIGNIIWTRTSSGIYKGTLVGAFIRDKAICPPYSSNFNDVGNSSVFLPLSTNGNPQLGWVNAYFGGTNNEDYLEIDTYDMSGRVEWSSIIGDGNLPIEIRVYN